MHLFGCGLEDLKADGSQKADMSRVGICNEYKYSIHIVKYISPIC